MTVMKMTDLYQVQEIAIKLFSQTLAQRRVYEELLRDVRGLPPFRNRLRTCGDDRYAFRF